MDTNIDRHTVFVICFAAILCYTTVNGQAQSFRVAPDDASMIKGQTVIFNCHVDNLKGRVQWSKNGFALGYDRTIPGLSRYSVIGNENLGEFDLMITALELSDDAEFQCQVSPSGGDAALIGPAKLNVLIPPIPPVIEGHTNGSVVRVRNEQESLSLTCISDQGKPAAAITWMKNEEEITEGIVYTVVESSNKVQKATSVLIFKPEDDDDGAMFRCLAKNDALVKAVETRVKLSVLHPPGAPEITGYSNGQVVKTGETLKLKCTSKGGNPLAQVYWYKNDMQLDFSYAIAGDTVENELVFPVQPNDMNAIYKCVVSNSVTATPLTTQVKLTVQFAPAKVTITGHESAKAGETIKLKCVTEISNPPALISWFSSGKEVAGAVSTTKESPLGGSITTSEISVQLTDRENGVFYHCHGTNEALGKTVVASIDLQVMYPPGAPVIMGYTEGRTVTSGQIQTMSCTSKGGNPLAEITWWKGNELIPSENTNAFNMVQSRVSFILTPDDNQAEYRCNATNEATITPLISSVKLNVNFPPDGLEISTEPAQIRAGENVIITCKSSTSNPASELTWWKNGEEISGISGGIVDAEYFGKSTISKLQLIMVPEENGEIYACKASNILIERAVSDAVTLDILFKPKFPSEVPSKIDIEENSQLVVNFTAFANPSEITYTWFKGNKKVIFGKAKKSKRDLNIPHILVDEGVLNITSIKKAQAGIYSLKAKNAEGETEHQFEFNVQYTGTVKTITKSLTIDAGGNATLECEVDANPLPDGAITWIREGYDFSRAVIEVEGSKSKLSFIETTKDDSGEFKCNVNNGIGEPGTGVAKLIVKFAPVIDKSPTMSKFAADKGTTAKLTCLAGGAPTLTFKWKMGNTDIDPATDKYNVATSEVGLVQYQSILSVLNTDKPDYGPYTCIATNELGEDTSVINLDGTSKPDSPYELRYLNSTHNSITITWKPSFNGGSTQWFQVRYKEIGIEVVKDGNDDSKAYKYEDVVPRNATIFEVGNLKLATRYEMSVRAINALGESNFIGEAIRMSTSAVAPLSSRSTDDVPLYIILTVVIIGMILLGLNVLLILLFIRKRRLRMEKDSETTSQANTVEMFNAPTITEDSKSYTSYGRMSLDEYPDEFYKPFDDEDEMKGFLPPNTYMGSENPMYPSLQSKYPYSQQPANDYRSLPRGGRSGGDGGVHPGAGSREGIIMDDHAAVASGLGPRFLDPYGISSLPRKDPEGAYMDSIHKSQQSLPTLPLGYSSQIAPPQTHPAFMGGSLKYPHHTFAPAPPNRSSSKGSQPGLESPGSKIMPPVPSRNYASEEIPRYAPPPGMRGIRPPPPPPPDVRGHLV